MAGTISVTPDALRASTAPSLLCELARSFPDRIALRSKHLGIYRQRTWRDYALLVARTAKAFANLGLRAGERVAIMGEACEEWVICDLAAQSLGAIVYGIYPTAAATEVEYQMRDGGAVIFIAEDQEYADKLLPLADRLPELRHLVVIDDSAMFDYDHAKLNSYRALLSDIVSDLDWLEAQARRLSPDDPAFIVYTSGTTGHPKGALIAHGKHLAAAANLVDHYPTLSAKPHRTVAYLPLCHVLGRDIAVTLPMISQMIPHFGAEADDPATTMFEVAPTVLFTVPRYLQKFAAQVLVGVGNSSPLKRASYQAAMTLARRHVRRHWNGANSAEALLYRIAQALVFRPILNKIGFDQLELVICGGAPLSRETMALWHMYAVNVVEMYGQTETAGGIIAGQCGPFPAPGNVGTPPSGWRVRLAEDGEVLVRNANVFEGYWRDEEATRAIKGADGWLRTGDIGEWDNGALRLVDRARDFIVTAGGKTLSPSFIENALRGSPYIAEAAVFGHGRKYLSALVEIDFDTVSDWARGNDVNYTGFTSLAQSPHVVQLIKGEIDKVNAQLARVEEVKVFRILPKMLDPEEEGEPVTPTRKVKRALMYERFKPLIEAMYDDREERLLAEEVGEVLRA
ncbi:MAG TPA: AMP-binding protein [Xanthobacteraceae bacterium]|nr:AMP-binding protein [Xanthobacteraceae bacterium]